MLSLCIKWSQSHFCHPDEATLEFWHCSQTRTLVLGFRSFALKFRVLWNFHVVLHVESRKEWHTGGVLSTALLHNSDSWVEVSVWNFSFWTRASWPRGNHVSLHCRNCYTCLLLCCIRNYAIFLWWPFFNRTMYSVNSDGILVQSELVYVSCITILSHTACQSPTLFYEMHCSNVEFHACISIYPPVLVCHLSTLNLLW